MHRIYALAAAALALSACQSSGPEQISYSRPSVTYRVGQDSGDRDMAADKAQAYCDNYGLDASPVRTSRSADAASFECR